MRRLSLLLVMIVLASAPAAAQKRLAFVDPVNLAELRTECLTNPNGYTYTDVTSNTTLTLSQWYAAEADNIVAEILNLARPGISVIRTDVRTQEIREAIDITDLDSVATGARLAWVQAFLASPEPTQLRRWNGPRTTLLNTQTMLNLLNSMVNTGGSETRLRAIAIRIGSRAEQRWGCVVDTAPGCENIVVQPFHVSMARQLP